MLVYSGALRAAVQTAVQQSNTAVKKPCPGAHLMTTSSPRRYLKKRMLSLSTSTARCPPLPPLLLSPPLLLALLLSSAPLTSSTSIGCTRRAEQNKSVHTHATPSHSSREPGCNFCDIAHSLGKGQTPAGEYLRTAGKGAFHGVGSSGCCADCCQLVLSGQFNCLNLAGLLNVSLICCSQS